MLTYRYRPQELGLTVWVNLADASAPKTLIPITAFNQTVSVVEAPSGFFDPALFFIYALLLAALTAGGWYAYQYYVDSTSPKGKGGKRSTVKPVVVPADQKKQEYPQVKAYEEDWIPAHHTQSGKAKKRTGKGGATSGDEVTSGGEITSGAESGPERKGKRKTKKA